MKAKTIQLLCLAFVSLILCGACASHTINGINLEKLGESRPNEGPRVDAFFEPTGNEHYALLGDYYAFAEPQPPMPRSHLFFALQKIVPGLDASDISLSAPVHVRAASYEIELTFRKNNNEAVTIKLPPEPDDEGLFGVLPPKRITYCKDGKLLIARNHDSTQPESYIQHENAIVFQMKNNKLAVHTREYQKTIQGFILFLPPSVDIQQEGYVYEMTAE